MIFNVLSITPCFISSPNLISMLSMSLALLLIKILTKKTKHFILNTQIHGDISQKVTHLLINIICIKTAINLVFHSVLRVQLEIFFILLSSLIYKYSKSVKIRSFSYNWCMRTIWTYKTYFFIKVFSCNLMVCSWISVRI